MSKEHEHDFVAEKYIVQKTKSDYIGDSGYKVSILNIEKVILFCRKCGHKIEKEASDVS